ncbi:MAG: hypothetical protein WEB00_15645 [Dehalococcoidia bacterium]
MRRRSILGALLLLITTSGLHWAGAADQPPAPRAETALGALAPAGVARSWGKDVSGQLGNGAPNSSQDAPVPVSLLTNVVELAGGGGHTLALLSDGTVMSWGDDGSGQLGNGATTGDQPAPTAVSGLSGVKAIAAGDNHSLALLNDGTVRAWGNDDDGQLGNGPTTGDQPAPVVVSGLGGVKAIAAGRDHSLAVLNEGTVRSWGNDDSGKLGNGATTGDQPAPVVVDGLSLVNEVAAGAFHSLALVNDGTVRAWGADDVGQLGNGDTTGDQPAPVAVGGLSGVKAIAAGDFHSLALRNNGTARSWGSNTFGELGSGEITGDQVAPVPVSGLSAAQAIAAGGLHSLALLNDGTVRAWGSDSFGELGNGATTGNQGAPVMVSGLSGVAAISAGESHSLAIVPACFGQPATLTGTSAGDTINGTAGVDIIHGGDGGDTIDGLAGDDIICGGDGDDTIIGGLGDDEIDGGPGLDGGRFPGPAVTVNLAAGTALAGSNVDTLLSIENARGSIAADTLIGNGAGNKLEGLAGADTLKGAGGSDNLLGGTGDDKLEGGPGGDTLAGGSDVDVVRYPGASALTINLGSGANNKGDSLSGIENVSGSNVADNITGSNGPNRLSGLGGGDTISGVGSPDEIFGGDGADNLSGGAGADSCSGGLGNDSADSSCETISGVP